jgi:predicted O-methyltransferase YrrM
MAVAEDHSDPEVSSAFADAWTVAERIPGWLTHDQARCLWDAAQGLGPGSTAVEIGSHQGRSTVALAKGAQRAGSTVVAIDPFLDGAVFGGQRTRQRFEQHVREAEVTDVVRLEPDYSQRVLSTWSDMVHLLYIDGKHDFWSCTRDIGWVAHMPPGASVFIHDAFSSVGVTASLIREQSRRRPQLRYRSRVGSLALFTVGQPSGSERLALVGELGWFSRNLMVKVLLRLRLRPATRLLGHDSPYDPY